MEKNGAQKGIVQYAMESGVYLGLYFVVKFVFEVFSMESFFCNTVAMAMMLCVPVVVYTLMRRYRRQVGMSCYFSQLWMMGILLFFFASLINSLVQYIYFVYINPDYIRAQFLAAVELMETFRPMMKDPSLLDIVKEGLDKGNVPSPMSVVVERIWVNLFFGSLLSAAMAGLAMFLPIKSKTTKR